MPTSVQRRVLFILIYERIMYFDWRQQVLFSVLVVAFPKEAIYILQCFCGVAVLWSQQLQLRYILVHLLLLRIQKSFFFNILFYKHTNIAFSGHQHRLKLSSYFKRYWLKLNLWHHLFVYQPMEPEPGLLRLRNKGSESLRNMREERTILAVVKGQPPHPLQQSPPLLLLQC